MNRINLNKLNNQQLEDHLYHLRNVLIYDRFYLSDKCISIQWAKIHKVKDELKKREVSND